MDPGREGRVSWLRKEALGEGGTAPPPPAAQSTVSPSEASDAVTEGTEEGDIPISDPNIFGTDLGTLMKINELGDQMPEDVQAVYNRITEPFKPSIWGNYQVVIENLRQSVTNQEVTDALAQAGKSDNTIKPGASLLEFYQVLGGPEAGNKKLDDAVNIAESVWKANNFPNIATAMEEFKASLAGYSQAETEKWVKVAQVPPMPEPEPAGLPVDAAEDQMGPGPTLLETEAYQSLEQLKDALIRMGPYQDTYNKILEQVDDEDQDSAKEALAAFFQGFPEGLCTLYGILVKAGMADPVDQNIVEEIMEQHPQIGPEDKKASGSHKGCKLAGLWLPPEDSGLYSTEKMEKTASGYVGGPSPSHYTHGPGEQRYCPKLRNSVNTIVCRYHCLDGLPVDDHQILCGEAIWRQSVMDKFSREYKDADGNWVGGYLNKRFEIERNTAEHPYQLKPGQRQAPINEDAWSPEKRLQEMRRSEASNRNYSETPGDPEDLYNWDPYESAGTTKNPHVFEKPRDAIAKNASSEGLKKKAMDFEDEDPAPECSACGGPLVELGALGNRMHYRCRNCGADFSADISQQEEVPEGPEQERAFYAKDDSWTRTADGKLNPFITTDETTYPYYIAAEKHGGNRYRFNDYETAKAFAEQKSLEDRTSYYLMKKDDDMTPAYHLEDVVGHAEEPAYDLTESAAKNSTKTADLAASKTCPNCGGNVDPEASKCPACGHAGNFAPQSPMDNAARSGVVTKEKSTLFPQAERRINGVWMVRVNGRNFFGDTVKEARGKAGLEELEKKRPSVEDLNRSIQKEMLPGIESPKGESWVKAPVAKPRKESPQEISEKMIGQATPSTPGEPVVSPGLAKPIEIQGGESEFSSEPHTSGDEVEMALASEVMNKPKEDQAMFEEWHQESKIIGPDPKAKQT